MNACKLSSEQSLQYLSLEDLGVYTLPWQMNCLFSPTGPRPSKRFSSSPLGNDPDYTKSAMMIIMPFPLQVPRIDRRLVHQL